MNASLSVPVGVLSPLAQVAARESGASCESLKKLVREVYDFEPAALSEEQRDAKSNATDRVWTRVQAHREERVPCLRGLPEDLALLRRVRRKRMTSVQSHALQDYVMYTSVLWVLTWKPELVK